MPSSPLLWGEEQYGSAQDMQEGNFPPSPLAGEGGPSNCAPSADAVAGNGPDGPAPTQSRQGWDGGEKRWGGNVLPPIQQSATLPRAALSARPWPGSLPVPSGPAGECLVSERQIRRGGRTVRQRQPDDTGSCRNSL